MTKTLFYCSLAFPFLQVFLFLGNLEGQENNKENRPQLSISHNFFPGPYLIYHCRNKYFACVDRTGDQLCRKWQLNSEKRQQERSHCLPIKEFEKQAQCEKEQLSLINRDRARDSSFCNLVD
jgi:predicted DNA-binding WGR domain protein